MFSTLTALGSSLTPVSTVAGGLPGRKQRPAPPASVLERPGQRSHPRHPRRGVSAQRGSRGHGAGLLHPWDHLLGVPHLSIWLSDVNTRPRPPSFPSDRLHFERAWKLCRARRGSIAQVQPMHPVTAWSVPEAAWGPEEIPSRIVCWQIPPSLVLVWGALSRKWAAEVILWPVLQCL